MNCELCGERVSESPQKEGEDDVRWCEPCRRRVGTVAARLLGESYTEPTSEPRAVMTLWYDTG